MLVHSYASLAHYEAHLAPVRAALPAEVLGGHHAPPGRPWGSPLGRRRAEGLWLVAGASDVQRLGKGTPCVYLEHGAGQSYSGDPRAARSMSYAGGDGLDQVALFLCPNEQVARRWRARYPDTPAVVVGCPWLDRFHVEPSPRVSGGPRVAVAFHWPNTLCPEAGTAWTHYRNHLAQLRDHVRAAEGELLGHGHPRAWRQYRQAWQRLGVEPVQDWAEVMDRADVLVVDNSSAGPEFASLGRPVVWLSAPWWRRDVHHGGRFWSWVVGMPHVADPEQLVPTVLEVLVNPSRCDDARKAMVASAYDYVDGRAAQRAAAAILEVLHR